MQELHARLAKLGKSEVVLDVREPEEFSEGHVPGSVNIPVGQVGQRFNELQKYERVYIHCRSGKRAQVAFHELTNKGLTNLVCIADGGMLDWQHAGYEIER